jgi:hypothetical protein
MTMSLSNVSPQLENPGESRLTRTGTRPPEECLNMPPSAVTGTCPGKDDPDFPLEGKTRDAVAWVLPLA